MTTPCPFCGFQVCFGTTFMVCDQSRVVNLAIERIRLKSIAEAKVSKP